MKKIGITDTTLRDAHQSLWATRMTTADMIPILERIDSLGYSSVEVWGGATFDVCMRYLNEDPWERLRILNKYFKRTPMQMLLRGQALVGYTHYPDDVVERFIAKSVENGIDIIRIFDALNDLRNMEKPIAVAKKEGAHVQGAFVYTVSPVHTTEHFVKVAQQLQEMGVDSVCLKDMAGLLTPYNAGHLVSLLKEKLDIPVHLHSHYVGGLAFGAYIKGIEAGADNVDCASVPLAFGSSQPPVETIVRTLNEGGKYTTGLDLHDVFEVASYFEDLRKKRGFERGVTRITDMGVFEHQVPGGMISNLVSQLKEQNAADKITDVLREIPRVRKELGYPPLVTPTSQIVGTQAVLNVLTHERYKIVPGEVKAYIRGEYGKPPGKIDERLRKKIIGDEPVYEGRPADLLEPGMEKAREEIKDMVTSEEDVLSYALFPQIARKFFAERHETKIEPVEQEVTGSMDHIVLEEVVGTDEEGENMKLNDIKELLKTLNETGTTEFNYDGDGVHLIVRRGKVVSVGDENGIDIPFEEESTEEVPEQDDQAVEEEEDLVVVEAPMVGTFYRAPAPDAPPFVQVGSKVKKGQTLCIVEAMKLMNELESEVDGEIVDILAENAEPVEYGRALFTIRRD